MSQISITLSKRKKNLVIEALENYLERLPFDFNYLSLEELEDRQINAEEIITDLTEDDEEE